MTTVVQEQPPTIHALTADGDIVTIRPVSEQDADAINALFARASGANLRLRFFVNPAGPLLSAEVQRLAQSPSPTEVTLGAELAGQLVGVASYARAHPADARAEFALFVDDAQQGRGIGTLLLEHLTRYARSQGIRQLYGEVLEANARMMRLATDLAPGATLQHRDGIVEVTLPTEADETALAAAEARDRAAGRASLRPLLQPASVAVVGAGRRGGVGHEVLKGLVRYGFHGPVYPINPHATAVAGVPAYPSLRDVPGRVELAVIAVPADQVLGVMNDAAAVGVRAAVVLTAGFAETGHAGQATQAELLHTARRHGIRLVGPNCLGVINTDPQIRLDASFLPTPPATGGLAVASQSGAVGIAMLDHLSRTGTGVSSFVSLGNKADVSGNDLIAYWYDDPDTRAVALYLESFGNPRKFARVARALARRKPVLAVFSGRSESGRRAGASHTAAAAAPYVAVDTLFAQAGVVRVDNLGELVDASRMLTGQPLPAGSRLGVVSNAGGANILAADAAELHGLRLPDRVGGLANPLDLGAGATPDALGQALATMASTNEVDTLLVIVAATRANDPAALWRSAGAVVDRYPQLPMAGVMLGGPEVTSMGGRQAPVFLFPEQAVRAIGQAAAYAAWRRQPLGSRPQLTGVDTAAAQQRVQAALAAHTGWQPYERTRDILGAYGIPLVPARTVTAPEQAVTAADQLGYPVVLKAADPELVHKTELGAVKLKLADAGAVTRAYREIAEALQQPTPPVLVQPMAAGEVELVTGIVHDPLFGSLVMLGLGGIFTDLLGDRAFRLVPMTDLDAGRMWRSLRSAPLLTGYRNRPAVDTDALEDLLLRLGRLAEELPEVAELDLNPVLAGPDGVVAVDAKLRLAPTGPEPEPVPGRLR